MPKKIFSVIFASVVAFLAGCSPVGSTIKPVTTNVTAKKYTRKVVVKDTQKVAIFPFADYSKEQSFLKNPKWGINRKIMEEVADAFIARGITVSNQEDVDGLLKSEGIISCMKPSDDPSSPEWELANKPHSKIMRADMINMISQDTRREPNDSNAIQGVTAGLSKEKVKELGRRLGVDKIIRGRIIEYGFADTKSLNPMNGLLPLVVGGLVEGMGAYVYQDAYETGLPGPSWTASDLVYDYEMGQGPGINLPSKQRSCFVQVRLYMQDTSDGSILWSNRVEIRFSPTSLLNYDENHPKNMTDKSIQGGVQLLMEDLFKDRKQEKFLGVL